MSSFPYGQFPGGDNYSTPSTPHEAFPQWDTIEREQQEMQQHQEQQQSQQQQQQSMMSRDLHSPIPGSFPATIHLEDPLPVVPSQAHDDTPIHLHPAHQDPSQNKPPPPTQSGSMIIRSGRSQQHQHAQQQTHPYHRRPSSSTPTVQRQQHQLQIYPAQQHVPQREHHVHFVPGPVARQGSGGVVASGIPSTSSARPSPLAPSPSSRITSFGSSVSNSPVATNPPSLRTSPRTMDPPALPTPVPSSTRPKSYIIRMDTQYDTDTHMLTAVLEMPGVKREHLSVRLSTCSYNRVRQITVSGVVHPPFGISPLINPAAHESAIGAVGPNMSVRERKYGPCQRVIPVPSDLKREDIEATMQDGVLILRFPCGMPGDDDSEDITVG